MTTRVVFTALMMMTGVHVDPMPIAINPVPIVVEVSLHVRVRVISHIRHTTDKEDTIILALCRIVLPCALPGSMLLAE
jgi:hypothetical protein